MTLARLASIAVLGAAATALGAQVSVPMVPIPTTLQTLAVAAVGLLAGPRAGAAAALLYLLLAFAGLPVLSGMQRYVGMDFVRYVGAGYVLGFIPGAALAGWLGHRRDYVHMLVAGVAAHGVVLAFGVVVLAVWLGPALAMERGLLPFVVGALAKSVLAATLVLLVRQASGLRKR